jgi:hypothetical protein
VGVALDALPSVAYHAIRKGDAMTTTTKTMTTRAPSFVQAVAILSLARPPHLRSGGFSGTTIEVLKRNGWADWMREDGRDVLRPTELGLAAAAKVRARHDCAEEGCPSVTRNLGPAYCRFECGF